MAVFIEGRRATGFFHNLGNILPRFLEKLLMGEIDWLFDVLIIYHPKSALGAIGIDFIIIKFPIKHEWTTPFKPSPHDDAGQFILLLGRARILLSWIPFNKWITIFSYKHAFAGNSRLGG